MSVLLIRLFHEYEINGCNQAAEGCEMIPVQSLSLKENIGDDGEDDERYAFLYHLELDQIKRSAIIHETDAVGWYLTAIFEEGDSPTEGDDTDKRPVAAHARLLQLEVSVPSQRHEDVAQHQ